MVRMAWHGVSVRARPAATPAAALAAPAAHGQHHTSIPRAQAVPVAGTFALPPPLHQQPHQQAHALVHPSARVALSLEAEGRRGVGLPPSLQGTLPSRKPTSSLLAAAMPT